MREIKFRAWITNHNTMHYSSEAGIDILIDWVERYPGSALMQYTGLKDRNGREIYEGDVVRALIDIGPAGEIETIFPVNIGVFGPNIEEWNYTENYLPEIIGNIYENPELLEGK